MIGLISSHDRIFATQGDDYCQGGIQTNLAIGYWQKS